MAEPVQTQPLLDDESLDILDEFLESDIVGPEALDIISAHGFMLALAIAPREVPSSLWLPELFQGQPSYESPQQEAEVVSLFEQMRANAIDALEHGVLPELLFELELGGADPVETPIGDWCAGFMEGVFMDEEAWFGAQEETAAELLLPFMAISGVFEDEDPEIGELIADPIGAQRFVNQLPELLLDLYLLYRVPPESPKPSPRRKGSAAPGAAGIPRSKHAGNKGSGKGGNKSGGKGGGKKR
ncbi:YecA family protein [bacterium Scap17]|nr:YecA family protein [bacterium Scap17]